MSNYNVLPSFDTGQVISASAHLNALQDYVSGLRDDYLGVQMPFTGLYWTNDKPWTYQWLGMIRHKVDVLDYNIQILNNRLVELKINDTVVASASSGTLSGTGVDISGLGLSTDEFYTVEVDTRNGAAHAIVWLLRERYVPSYQSLAAFTDGTTPSASDWQNLTLNASTLKTVLQPPVALGNVQKGVPRTGNHPDVYIWAGNFNHRCQYLKYKIYLKEPYPHGIDSWIEARVYYNSTLAMKLRVGKQSSSADGSEYYEEFTTGSTHTFEGTLDLDTYPGSLTVGSDYQVYVKITDSTFWDTESDAHVEQLYEVPASTLSLSGWTSMASWSHGDYVKGDSGSPQVKPIRDNLNLLQGQAVYSNYPALSNRHGTLYGKRRRRWLHYRNASGDTAKLVYTLRGDEQEVTLPDASSQWLVVDLDSINGLYQGLDYTLKDATYALEDIIP